MKIILVTLSILISGIFTESYTIDTAAVKYYPLAVGNVWTYNHFATNGPSYRFQEKITGTIVTNGHFYYIFIYQRTGYPQEITYRRIDSVKNNVLIYSASSGCNWLINEMTSDSLNSQKGDSSLFNCVYYYRTDTLTKSLFGSPRKTKKYSWTNYFEAGTSRELTRDFGLTYISSFAHTNQSQDALLGCVINGILYGDTTLVGINQLSTEIPKTFSLSQNYPNPFNPVTHIGFRVADFGLVKLTIYDAVGKEIKILVNQQLQPGIYEAEWITSSYPSGVYYYRIAIPSDKLETENYSETRKMVLIK